MKSTDDATPDGGSVDTSLFETISDTEFSKQEQYRLWFKEFVLAPAKIIWSDWRARYGLFIILFYVLMGTVGVYIVEAPNTNGPLLIQPFQNWAYPLGTDRLGQGILSLTVHSTPPMLLMLLSGAVFTTALATVVGTVSGYKGGAVDRVIMSLNDVMMTIPGLPLVIVVAVSLQPRNPLVVGVILSINAWAGLARALRSQVLPLREREYVENSRTMGIPTHRIITKDLLPNLMPYIAVNFVAAGRRVIFTSVALYFIGALPFSRLNWGVMLNMAYGRGALYTWGAIHWIIVPILAIVILTVGLILFAQGTERIFNPRIRARHVDTEDGEDVPTHPSSGGTR